MPVYGLAEQAANIIRAQWNGVSLTQPSSVSPPSATTSQPGATNTLTSKNAAAWARPSAFFAPLAVAAAFLLGL